MMGAAENIADLRSLLSIVAEETDALKMKDADEDSVGWTTEGPLPMTFGHVRRAHSALAALEAALSAAEPVKPASEEYQHPDWIWYCESNTGPVVTLGRWAKTPNQRRYKLADIQPTEHDHPAPSVAVKALEWKSDRTAKAFGATWMVWSYSDPLNDGLGNWLWQVVDAHPHASGRFHTEEEAKAAAQADYEARIRSTLSAQVHDVAVAEIVSKYGDPEAFGERELIPLVDIQKYPYGTKLYAAAPSKQEAGHVTSQ